MPARSSARPDSRSTAGRDRRSRSARVRGRLTGDPHAKPRWLRAWRGVLLALRKLSVPMIALATVALAACGGGSAKVSTTGGSATTTTTTTGGGFNSTAFTACLKQHGVTLPAGFGGGFRGGTGRPGAGLRGGSGGRGFPRGGSGGRGFFGGAGPSAAQQSAFQACRSSLPNGGRFGGRGFAGGASASQLRAYMSCLSDNGVKVPTTTTTPA